jgi:hypothetical protein
LQLGSFAQRPDCPEGLIAWLALQPVRRSAATTTEMQNLIGAGQWDVRLVDAQGAITRSVAGGGDLTEQRTLNFNSTRCSEYEAAGNADHRDAAARFWGELPLDPAVASGTTGLSRGHDKTYRGDPIDILTQPLWVHPQAIQKTPREPLSKTPGNAGGRGSLAAYTGIS